jgi:hypothetical protein
MLRNRLIRYVANENGAYLFAPTVPLSVLGLPIRHISGFDYDAFADVPVSTMVGTAGPIFLEIDVAAPVAELRKRALAAGLVPADAADHRHGFEVSASDHGYGSYLASERTRGSASISCVRSGS